MLDEIRAGNMATVIIKDQSRIGRDVINEWYVADISRKIKTVFKSRMEKGLRCSGSVCYGYRASKKEKGEWIIDEEAAAVVRRIFQSVLAGETVRRAPKRQNAPNLDIYLNFIGAFEVPAHIVTPAEVEEQRRQQEEQAAKEARSKELAKARYEKRKASFAFMFY